MSPTGILLPYELLFWVRLLTCFELMTYCGCSKNHVDLVRALLLNALLIYIHVVSFIICSAEERLKNPLSDDNVLHYGDGNFEASPW